MIRIIVLLLVLVPLIGCRSQDQAVCFDDHAVYQPYVQQIEYPDSCLDDLTSIELASHTAPPSVRNPAEAEKWPLTLEEAVQLALTNSRVVRDLGGQVVAAPSAARTVFDPALAEADPRAGVEAALAAFDAQFRVALFAEQSDRAFNNIFFGAGNTGLLSHLGNFEAGITKTAATGTQFSLENITTYNRNPAAVNLFSSVYDTIFQAGFRHPLARGAGVEFNRIAGPTATPGNYNGVLIARINSDVSIADFELGVRNLLRDVERTYWELYFAYRDFDAKLEGRRLALEAWDLEKRRADAGVRTSDQEAFARQQYYLAQAAVENALSGTAAGAGGIYSSERQLRALLGLPAVDGRLIVPTDEPVTVDVRFDWQQSLVSALTRRAELRRQQWLVKRRDLELIAAHNFQRMQIDLVGLYRWRGFGDNLLGENGLGNGSAFESLLDGNLQDWQVGVELTTPVGNRQGHAAVRHAEWQLAREHALYDELELRITHDLRGAFTELDRAYVVTRSRYNQRVASFQRLDAERKRNEQGVTDLDLVLDAQRQAVDAESNYFRALVDYNLALLNLHHTQGTLLDYQNVALAESGWTEAAHRSAAKLSRRFLPRLLDYRIEHAPPVSRGPIAWSSETDVAPTPAATDPAATDPAAADPAATAAPADASERLPAPTPADGADAASR